MLGDPHVGVRACANGKTAAAEETSEESADVKGAERAGEASTEGEEEGRREETHVDDTTTEGLAYRGGDHRSEGQAQDV